MFESCLSNTTSRSTFFVYEASIFLGSYSNVQMKLTENRTMLSFYLGRQVCVCKAYLLFLDLPFQPFHCHADSFIKLKFRFIHSQVVVLLILLQMKTLALVPLVKVLKSFSRSSSSPASIPKNEYGLRRSKLAEKIGHSCLSDQGSVSHHLVIIPAAEIQYSSLHVPYPFRQDSYFRYLTGITEPDAVLALEIATKSSDVVNFTPRLFVEERNPHDMLWDGPTIGVDGAALTTGIQCTMPRKLFPEYLQMAMSGFSGPGCFFWFSTPFIVRSETKAPVNRTIYSVVSEKFTGCRLDQSNLRNPNPLIDELRLIKSKSELLLMKRAVKLTSIALKKTLASAYPGMREAELAARFEFESALMGSGLGYPPVVAGGNRANIIHYLKNSECVEDGQLVLMDVGCDVEGYTADISRAWPINGNSKYLP